MIDVHEMLLRAHLLRLGGAPFSKDRVMTHNSPKDTSGPGHALCSCGTMSEELPSGEARRNWHGKHRMAADEGHPLYDPEKMQGDGSCSCNLEGNDHWLHDKTCPLYKPRGRKVQEAPQAAQQPSERPNSAPAPTATQNGPVAVYAGAARVFWPNLGEDAAVRIANALGAEVSIDRRERSLTVSSGEGADAIASLLMEFWPKANKDFHFWKRNDDNYKFIRYGIGDMDEVRNQELVWFGDFTTGVIDRLLGLEPRSEDPGYLAGQSSGLTLNTERKSPDELLAELI